jgi:hypothetical protein
MENQMSFDAQSFLDAAVSGTNDTKLIPVPVGEYQAFVDSVEPRPWQSKDGTKSGIALDVFWSIEDADVKAFLGRDSVKVKQGIMLDLTPQGGLDMSKGKNIGLGRLREAVGKNEPGQSFSFNQLPGLMAKVSVTHRVVSDDVFAEVKGVAKL